MPEEKPIWGIHMEWHHELKAIEQNYVSIGWPAVGDLSKISPDREAFKKSVAAAYPWPAPIEWSGGHVSLRLGAVPA